MTAPTLYLINERTGFRVSFGFNDLPENAITWGGRMRREVTEYIGTDIRTIQVMGPTYEPITLNGAFDDQYLGNRRGHAINKRREVEALWLSGDIIRLEYNNDVRWGFIDPKFDEETPERILYEIRFKPEFATPPKAPQLLKTETPLDSTTRAQDAFEELDTTARAAPAEVSPSILSQVYTALDAVDAQLNSINSYLVDVTYFADVTNEIAARINKSLGGAIKRLGDVQLALADAGEGVITEATGVGELLCTGWRDEVSRLTWRTRSICLAYYISLLRIIEPTRSFVHVVRQGETLEHIALTYYSDFTLWTLIADANGLETDDVPEGTRLDIPPAPQV